MWWSCSYLPTAEAGSEGLRLRQARGTDNLSEHTSRSCARAGSGRGPRSDSALRKTIDRDLSSFGFGPRRTRLGMPASCRCPNARAKCSTRCARTKESSSRSSRGVARSAPLREEDERHWNTAHPNSAQSLQCEEQDSNLHVLRTLEPKSSASANSAILAFQLALDG